MEAVSIAVVVAGNVMEAGIAQVTGLVAPEGAVVTAQLRLTVPVKPLAGVAVMVEVLPVFTPCTTVIAPPAVSENVGVVDWPLTFAVTPRVWMY